jgi:hypothetical protein
MHLNAHPITLQCWHILEYLHTAWISNRTAFCAIQRNLSVEKGLVRNARVRIVALHRRFVEVQLINTHCIFTSTLRFIHIVHCGRWIESSFLCGSHMQLLLTVVKAWRWHEPCLTFELIPLLTVSCTQHYQEWGQEEIRCVYSQRRTRDKTALTLYFPNCYCKHNDLWVKADRRGVLVLYNFKIVNMVRGGGRAVPSLINDNFEHLDKVTNSSGRCFWKCKHCDYLDNSPDAKIPLKVATIIYLAIISSALLQGCYSRALPNAPQAAVVDEMGS